jgi:tetratricopeptide (TPR) repeat protein
MGSTPLRVTQLKAGSYSLRLEKDGFVALVSAVELSSAGSDIYHVLKPLGVGLLNVELKPYGAEVLLDGEFVGQTPLNLEVPVGRHELQVRKTNFKPRTWQVEVETTQPISFSGFGLEDQILTMLKQQMEVDKTRASNYMDLGHYYYNNGEIDLAADNYEKAIEVAATPLVFEPNTEPLERALQTRLRSEDTNRLNEEIKKKSLHEVKNVTRFNQRLLKKQEEVANTNFTEWTWVRESAQNFSNQNKFDQAESILLKHIHVTPAGTFSIPQAYIMLVEMQVKLRKFDKAQETFEKIYTLFTSQPDILRQCANILYRTHSLFQGEERRTVLGLAEKLLLKGVESGRKHGLEQQSLCHFELANVMVLQGRIDESVAMYTKSIEGTRSPNAKEQRRVRLVEAYIQIGNYGEARSLLQGLCASTDASIAKEASVNLYKLNQTNPSPDAEKK